MSDPTVTALMTKLLCSHGGRIPRDRLCELLVLPPEQIEQILKDEPLKFPVVGDLVLVQSPMRICPKYLRKELEEKCEKLHLCRDFLRGKCERLRCSFSHDVSSGHNQSVLKANGASGLTEDEIRALLLQNDHQILPEVCVKYIHDTCDLGKDCSRLHVCGFFTRGECNRRTCRFSHHLLEASSELLLTRCQMSQVSVQNFQMLCMVKHNERLQTPSDPGKKSVEKGNPAARRGRGRGGHGKKKNETRSKSRGRQGDRAGSNFYGRSSSRPTSENGERLLSWSGDDDDKSEPPKTRAEQILEDWFSSPLPDTDDGGASFLYTTARTSSHVRLLMSSGTHKPMPTKSRIPTASPQGSSSQPGIPTGLLVPSSTPSVPQPKLSITSLTTTSQVNVPSKPTNLHMKVPSIVDYIEPMSPSVVKSPSVTPVPPTSSSKMFDSPVKRPSVPLEKPVITSVASPSIPKPVSTIKPVTTSVVSPSTAPSPSYPGLLNSPKEGPPVHLVKPVQSRVRKSSQKKVESNKVPEICLSNLWKYCKLEGRCPDMHYYLPYRWQIYKGTNWEDVPDMEEVEKCYCDPKVDRIHLIDFLTMRSGEHRVRRLSTVSSVVKPSEYVLTNEWLWYWKDEYGTWRQYGHSNVKHVSSNIVSSELENVYLSNPIAVSSLTTGSQTYEINFREMKQKNIKNMMEKDVRRRPKYLSFEDVKLLRGSTRSAAAKSLLKLETSPLTSETSPLTSETSPLTSETSSLKSGASPLKSGASPLKSGASPLKSGASPLKSGASPLKSGASPLKSGTSPLNTDIYPKTWDPEAMPEIGCMKVLVSDTSREFSEIVSSFSKTVSGHKVKNLWRLQNPFLWQGFQRQKEQMKKVNQGRDVKEICLFYGTDSKHIDDICNQNIDWRICGTHGTVYGQGSYFARDASYSHTYSTPTSSGTRAMFVARLLVGDYVKGDPQMKRPPLRPGSSRYYDSCVDDTNDPSIFVVFEKLQIYPEYLLEYKKQKKSCIIC